MDILLNDEEMQVVKDGIKKPRVPDDFVEAIKLSSRLINETYDAVAKAQLKKVVDWMEEGCTHELGWLRKWSCPLCRQNLKEEVE